MCVCVCVCVSVHQVLELEDKKGEWGFKALKQMMKILFRKVAPIQFTMRVMYMRISENHNSLGCERPSRP